MARFNPSSYSIQNPAPSVGASATAAGLESFITTYRSGKAAQQAAPVVPPAGELETGTGEETPWGLIIAGGILIGGLGTAAFLMTRKSDVE